MNSTCASPSACRASESSVLVGTAIARDVRPPPPPNQSCLGNRVQVQLFATAGGQIGVTGEMTLFHQQCIILPGYDWGDSQVSSTISGMRSNRECVCVHRKLRRNDHGRPRSMGDCSSRWHLRFDSADVHSRVLRSKGSHLLLESVLTGNAEVGRPNY